VATEDRRYVSFSSKSFCAWAALRLSGMTRVEAGETGARACGGLPCRHQTLLFGLFHGNDGKKRSRGMADAMLRTSSIWAKVTTSIETAVRAETLPMKRSSRKRRSGDTT